MRLLLLAASCLLMLSSCRFYMGERVSGDGNITTEQKTVGSFHSIDVSGSVKVHVKQEPVSGVKLQTDANLMQYLEVYTSGNTLVIRTKKGFNLRPSKEIIAYVSAPSFRDIEVSGACDIIGDNQISGTESLTMQVSGAGDINMAVSVPKLNTDISGSGSVKLRGEAAEFHASISGSGDVRCFDLLTNSTELDISGAGEAEISAEKALDVEVSGAGSVRYRGNPSVSRSISGAGSVRKVD